MMKLHEVNYSVKTQRIEESELPGVIAEHISGEANVYAILDFAVVLGNYQNGKLLVGNASTLQVTPLSMEYISEIRVFQNNKELRAVRSQQHFICRIVEDTLEGGSISCWAMDEAQKLWGKVISNPVKGWSLLKSDRGTRLLYPREERPGTELAVKIRNYIRFFDAQDEMGLTEYVDDRMLGYEVWPCLEEV